MSHNDSCKQNADAATNKPQIMEGIDTPTIDDISFAAGATGTSTTPENNASTSPATSGITAAQINGGKYIKGTAAINFGSIDFPEPGIYRYIITESIKTGGDGITIEAPATRFMDVYVTNNTDYSALQVESVIIHKNNDNVTNGTGVAEKDTGFINNYITSDLSLAKQVTGNQGFRGKYFKFTVNITGALKGTQYVVDGTLNTAPTGQAAASTNPLTVGDNGTVTGTFYLKHGEQINIRGLTSNTGYTITEVIEDTEGYTVSNTIVGGTSSTTGKTATVEKIGTDDDTVTFTNNRQGVVPTGILLDIWPYLLIVAVAAVALIVLLFKKRKHTTRY